MATDIIGRELSIGDYVAFYGAVYIVKGLPKSHRSNYLAIKLENPSKTTKTVLKRGDEMCLITREEALIWKLKDANPR